jgi:hypothetical protein
MMMGGYFYHIPHSAASLLEMWSVCEQEDSRGCGATACRLLLSHSRQQAAGIRQQAAGTLCSKGRRLASKRRSLRREAQEEPRKEERGARGGRSKRIHTLHRPVL